MSKELREDFQFKDGMFNLTCLLLKDVNEKKKRSRI